MIHITKSNMSQIPAGLNWKIYKKKPINITAVQINEDFQVETMEGLMKGKAGDFLIEGVRGELYPCDLGIFEETYDKVE